MYVYPPNLLRRFDDDFTARKGRAPRKADKEVGAHGVAAYSASCPLLLRQVDVLMAVCCGLVCAGYAATISEVPRGEAG